MRARVLAPATIGPENVVRRRPADMTTIYGKSPEIEIHSPAILSRPGWQGAYEGATIDRAPGNTNDDLITRDRTGMFIRRDPSFTATGPGNFNGLLSGPPRDILTFRFVRNIRPLVGGSHQADWGKHTNIPSGTKSGAQSQPGRKRMRAGKQNRLTVQRYRGQSFSSTTQVVR